MAAAAEAVAAAANAAFSKLFEFVQYAAAPAVAGSAPPKEQNLVTSAERRPTALLMKAAEAEAEAAAAAEAATRGLLNPRSIINSIDRTLRPREAAAPDRRRSNPS